MSSPSNRRALISLLLIAAFLLAGCAQQQTPAEKMYTVLEKVVEAEKGFEDQQKPLVAAETKEEKLYNQIIALGMKQYNEIVRLSDEALALVEKRRTYMDNETKSLKESEKQFQKIKEIKDDLQQKELKRQANQLYDIMEKRYRIHEQLYNQYMKSLAYDKQLYQMLKDKNVSLDRLEEQISKLNGIYQQLVETNNKFNELTKQYNLHKRQFYQTAGLKTKKTS